MVLTALIATKRSDATGFSKAGFEQRPLGPDHSRPSPISNLVIAAMRIRCGSDLTKPIGSDLIRSNSAEPFLPNRCQLTIADPSTSRWQRYAGPMVPARQPANLLLILLTLALLASACGGTAESGEGPTQFGDERVVDIEGGVCGLLTSEDVEVLAGRDLEDGQRTVGANCDWKLTDNELQDGVGITLEVDPLSVHGTEAADFERFLASSFSEIIPIDGLGDVAWATIPVNVSDDINSVAVVRGDNTLTLSALFLDIEPGSPQFEALVETARVAVTRLDERLASS